MALVPNQKCTCGYTRFRDRRVSSEETVARWMLFDGSPGLGGFGATPFGTFFGAGVGEAWGLFSSSLKISYLEVSCEACARVRSRKRLGGAAIFGVFLQENVVGIAVSDVIRPTSCYALRVSGPDGTFQLALSFAPTSPPPIVAPAPPTVSPVPPVGASTVNTVLTCTLPEIVQTGLYTLTFVDLCGGFETTLVEILLEGTPMFLSPRDADLGGAPIRWLRGSRLLPGAVQPAQSTRESIPFDKCTAVVEYDSRTGVLPDLTGWTRSGSGPSTEWSLVPGGGLRLSTSGGNTNTYTQTLALTSSLSQVYMYASVLPELIGSGAVGEGLEVQALYGTATLPYDGVRVNVRDQYYPTTLDGTSDSGFGFFLLPEWISVGGGDAAGVAEAAYTRSTFEDLGISSNTLYGVSLATAPSTSLDVSFGNPSGGIPVTACLRNVVAADGRFIRPLFSTMAQVTAPKLRLYLAAESGVSVAKTARFKIAYGTAAGSAYSPLTLTAEATVNLSVANSIYEMVFSLPGLVANQPFWFFVERDWTHPDDLLDSTVHLFHATVRPL